MKVLMHTRSNKFGLNGKHLVLKEITGTRVTCLVPEADLPESERFGSEVRPVDFEVSDLKAVIGTITAEAEEVKPLQATAPALTPIEAANEANKADAADSDKAGTEEIPPVTVGSKKAADKK